MTFRVLTLLAVLISACAEASPPCEQRSFEKDEFTVCRFDAKAHDFRLVLQDTGGQPHRSLSALSSDLGEARERVRFAMNAGMYDAAGAPVGAYVSEGREIRSLNAGSGAGNFYMKPNGVFWVGAGDDVHVSTTDDYAAAAPAPRWATQSGPMLVIDGALHPAIQPDGASRNIRNGVGVLDSDTAFFVISEGKVSFGKLARFFRDELKCPDALYLDGFVSSLWHPAANRMDTGYDLGPMLVVSDRRQAAPTSP
jgi:uncharacterized protein YigE (DUF2233 family)